MKMYVALLFIEHLHERHVWHTLQKRQATIYLLEDCEADGNTR
jgi:hypothetical protein